MAAEDVLRTHLQELRRGTVVVASYGYALLRLLAEHGFSVDANTLYPLLRRLEDQGLLTSEWNTEESRPRRIYHTSTDGEQTLTLLLADMETTQGALTSLSKGDSR